MESSWIIVVRHNLYMSFGTAFALRLCKQLNAEREQGQQVEFPGSPLLLVLWPLALRAANFIRLNTFYLWLKFTELL